MTNILAQIIVTLATNVYDIPNTTPPIRVAWIERRQEAVFQIQGGEFHGRTFKEFLRSDFIREAWLEAKPVAPLLSSMATIGKPPVWGNEPGAVPFPGETAAQNIEPIVPRATELEAKP